MVSWNINNRGDRMEKGLVHIYTGDGKGKTTSAIGLGIRAFGRGFKVLLAQFLKGMDTGELHVLENLGPNFEIYRHKNVKGFFWNMNDQQKEELKKSVREGFQHVKEEIASEKWDMVILDEIMGTIHNKLIDTSEVAELIKNKPVKLELILTGRNAPQELIALADYVSEIKAIKHPMDQGIKARKGIEY